MASQHLRSLFTGSIVRNLVQSILTLTLFSFIGISFPARAQNAKHSDRKVLVQVKPLYPPTLKSLHIEGLVRLSVAVLPDGSVSGISVRGGNPILVENAVKAVKSWKFAPASSQTEEELVLNFSDR